MNMQKIKLLGISLLLYLYFVTITLLVCLSQGNFCFSFIFISWRLITLQYCSGFCHTLTWISPKETLSSLVILRSHKLCTLDTTPLSHLFHQLRQLVHTPFKPGHHQGCQVPQPVCWVCPHPVKNVDNKTWWPLEYPLVAIIELYATLTQVNGSWLGSTPSKGNNIPKVRKVETMSGVAPICFVSCPWQNGKLLMKVSFDFFIGELNFSTYCNWTMKKWNSSKLWNTRFKTLKTRTQTLKGLISDGWKGINWHQN